MKSTDQPQSQEAPRLGSDQSSARTGNEGHFFGRRDILTFVRETLEAGRDPLIVLEGPRRIGKTSLLLHLEAQIKAPFLPVYFDLRDRADQPFPMCIRDLVDKIILATGGTPPARRRLEDVGQVHRDLVQALNETAGDRRVVILLDELFPPLEPLPTGAAGVQLYPYMHELAKLENPPFFVMAQGGLRPAPWNLKGSDLFGEAPRRNIPLLKKIHACGLLTAFSEGDTEFDKEALKKLLELTGNHPELLSLAGRTLMALPRGENSGPIGVDEVLSALPEILERGRESLEWMWDGLTVVEQEVAEAAAQMANSSAPVSLSGLQEMLCLQLGSVSSEELEDALEGLEANLIFRRSPEGEASFVSTLVHEWRREELPAEASVGVWLESDENQTAIPMENLAALEGRAANPEPPEKVRSPSGEALLDQAQVESLWWATVESNRASARPEEQPLVQKPRPLLPPPLREEVPLPPARQMQGEREDAADPEEESAAPPAERLLEVASAALNKRDYEAAETDFKTALAADALSVEAVIGLARVYEETGRFRQATAALRRIASSAPDRHRECLGELYVRWLDELTGSEPWANVLEEALRHLPDHPELRRRRRTAIATNIHKLLDEDRAVEAAAALGGLGPDLGEVLREVLVPLLDKLETLTERHDPEAAPLFSILRTLAPEQEYVWERYLGSLIKEAESTMSEDIDLAETLFRRAESAISTAPPNALVPERLRERLEASSKRMASCRKRADEAELATVLSRGDLDDAETWLEDVLSKRRAEHLERKLQEIRHQRRFGQLFENARQHCREGDFQEAQRLLASIVGQSPHFQGPDGRSAIVLLDEVTELKGRRWQAPPRPRPRRAHVVGAFVSGALLMGLVTWTSPFLLNLGEPSASDTVASSSLLVNSALVPRDLNLGSGGTEKSAALSGAFEEPGDKLANQVRVSSGDTSKPPTSQLGSSVRPTATRESGAFPSDKGRKGLESTLSELGRGASASSGPERVRPSSQTSKPAVLPVAKVTRDIDGEQELGASVSEREKGLGVHVSNPASRGDRENVTRVAALPRSSSHRAASGVSGSSSSREGAGVTRDAASADSGREDVLTMATANSKAVETAVGDRTGEASKPPQSSSRIASLPPEPKPRRMLSGDPNDPVTIGMKAARQGRTRDALAAIRSALASNPNRADAYAALGDIYRDQGRGLDALMAYQKAVKLDDSLTDVHYSLGKLHQTQGNSDAAIAAFRVVTSQDGAGRLGQLARARLESLQNSTDDSAIYGRGDGAPIRLFK